MKVFPPPPKGLAKHVPSGMDCCSVFSLCFFFLSSFFPPSITNNTSSPPTHKRSVRNEISLT